METARKIDHSKDEYYLSYALLDLKHRYGDDPKEECPLDNNRIKDGYIECKSTGRGYSNSDNMKFKSFTLHSIVDGDDIVNYAHGDVGYDFNPDSINAFAGGWYDLYTNNNANNLINNKELLSKKKLGLTYVDENGKVHEIMNKKYQNRVRLFKNAANGESDDESIKKRIFKEKRDKKRDNDDDSFNDENYTVSSSNEKEKFIRTSCNKINEALEQFNKEVPINTCNEFCIFYNNKTGKVYDISANELLCTAKDPTKGIKVDRIFVLESKLQELQYKQKNVGGNYNGIYDRYINKLTDVLIEQFPFGEIRVVKGSIEEGQTNEFLSPEEFINKYFVNKEDKKKYLEKLKSKRKEVKLKENNSEKEEKQNIKYDSDLNIQLECYIEQPQQLTKEQNFKNILNGFKVIKGKLGEGEAKIDPKSGNNKIFLNDKWYDRAHLTETGVVKSQINKVFDSYVRGKINDEDAKRQLNNIVNSHQRFFNSIYC